jgi:hypothetical protein
MPTMATNSRTWKKAESRVAALFGARRQPLSGSSGRDDLTSSDTTHPRLFIEAKYRERHAVRTLYDKTKALARKEGKTPVLALIDKNRPGFLLCVHCEDMPALAAEFLALAEESPAKPPSTLLSPNDGGEAGVRYRSSTI